MKTLRLTVQDDLYETLLAMLKGLPEKDIRIIEDEPMTNDEKERSRVDISLFEGKIDSFKEICDPVAWQQEIRSEWDRAWDQ